MPTTPINGWPTPADADFVINGAAAIRDFANAVDEDALVNNGDQVITAGSLTLDSDGTTARTLDVIREVSSVDTTARVVVATHGNGSAMLQRLRGADEEVGLRVEGNGQAGVVKGATHRPIAFGMAAGRESVPNATNYVVTFPAGRFTASPNAFVTSERDDTSGDMVWIRTINSSSMTIRHNRGAATFMQWVAIQIAA